MSRFEFVECPLSTRCGRWQQASQRYGRVEKFLELEAKRVANLARLNPVQMIVFDALGWFVLKPRCVEIGNVGALSIEEIKHVDPILARPRR